MTIERGMSLRVRELDRLKPVQAGANVDWRVLTESGPTNR